MKKPQRGHRRSLSPEFVLRTTSATVDDSAAALIAKLETLELFT